MTPPPAGNRDFHWASICWLLLTGCGSDSLSPDPSLEKKRGRPTVSETAGTAKTGETEANSGIFAERAAEADLDFMHFNGMTGEYYMAEVTGSGGALLDYDNDGDLDVYLAQGALLGPGKTLDDVIFPPRRPLEMGDRLFRNELAASGDASSLRFTDVTAAAGLEAPGYEGYGMGVAAGDYDNDGWVDLYVTNLGSNQMLRNRGNGTFDDTTALTGTGEDRWSVPATFFDYDNDGWLDLYVGNYIAADLENRTICRDFIGGRDYCGPGAFRSHSDRLFHNRRDGTFADVTAESGFESSARGALGVVAADFNRDGWMDLYVANDAAPNNLWINQGDGSFVDEALLAGCSVNAEGKAEASMGVDAGDFDNDGDLDLFVTHLTGETNTFYLNDGDGNFTDSTLATGLGPASRPFTSFGTSAFDYDNDGWLDILIVSGAVKKIEALARAGDPFPVHQTNQLFHNLGGIRFEDVTEQAGAAFELSEVSRGALFGDLDNDGDIDVVIVNNSGPARLLINQVGNAREWIGLRAVSSTPKRDQLGALLAIDRPGLPPLWRRVTTDGSFCSANDPRVLAGLGANADIERVRIYWPGGDAEAFTGLTAGRYWELVKGTGEAISPLS